MGRRAAEIVSDWGPDRFARGAIEALDLARSTTAAARSHRIDRVAKEINRCSERSAERACGFRDRGTTP